MWILIKTEDIKLKMSFAIKHRSKCFGMDGVLYCGKITKMLQNKKGDKLVNFLY